MQIFYSNTHDTFYMVPLRCGFYYMSTFAEYNTNDIVKLADCVSDNDALEFFGSLDHVRLLTILFNMPKFKHTSVCIVFRDPMVRYKSGLYVTAMSCLSENYLNTCSPHDLDRAVKHSLQNMAHSYVNSIFPQLDFGNVHTMPVLVQALMVYCCFPEKVKFLHISELTPHMETHYAVDGIECPRSGRIDTEVAHPTDENRYQRLVDVIPSQDIVDWIEPDRIVYDYIRDNYNNLNKVTALQTLMSVLDIPNNISRHKSILLTARSAMALLPDNVKEKIQSQFDDLASSINQKVCKRMDTWQSNKSDP